MKNPYNIAYFLAAFLISLVTGFKLSYMITLEMFHNNKLIDYSVFVLIGLAFTALGYLLFSVCATIFESEEVEKLSGELIDKFIKDGHEYRINVREKFSKDICTMDVSKKYYYDIAKIGMQLEFEKSTGVITNDEYYSIEDPTEE